MNSPTQDPKIIIKNSLEGDWGEHPRFQNIWMKPLYTREENPHASLNMVRVPPGAMINSHSHGTQIETIYILSGEAVMNFEDADHTFLEGSIVAMPVGIRHSLRNEGNQDVLLLTIFTPPL